MSLLDVLRAAHYAPSLYLKSDSHWSMYGAYVAYRELVRVRGDELGLRDWGFGEADFTMNSGASMSGDLARMSGVPASDAVLTVPAVPGHCYLPLDASVTATQERVRDQIVQVIACDGTGVVLVLHDSYMSRQVGFLAPNFRTVYLAAQATDLAKLIEEIHPDAVIEQRIERVLGGVPAIDSLPH